MKNIKKELGQRIRYYRKKANLTQWELSEKAKLHYTYIGSIERGEKNITIENIKKIADSLNISLTELFNISFENYTPTEDSEKELLINKTLKYLKKLNKKELEHIFRIIKEILNFRE